MSLEEVKSLVDRVSRGILGGQSIEVMDVPLGSFPGATEIRKGDAAPDGHITVYSAAAAAAAAESEIDVLRAVSQESGSAAAIKTFKNTELGATWLEEGEAPDWQRLIERREDYRIGSVALGGLLLVAGAGAGPCLLTRDSLSDQ